MLTFLSTIAGGFFTLLSVKFTKCLENKKQVKQMSEQFSFHLPMLKVFVKKINNLTDSNSLIHGEDANTKFMLPNGLELWNLNNELNDNDLAILKSSLEDLNYQNNDEDIYNKFAKSDVYLDNKKFSTIKFFLNDTKPENMTIEGVNSTIISNLKSYEEIIKNYSMSLYMLEDKNRYLIYDLNVYINDILNSFQKINNPNLDTELSYYKLTITKKYFLFHITIFQLELILQKKSSNKENFKNLSNSI